MMKASGGEVRGDLDSIGGVMLGVGRIGDDGVSGGTNGGGDSSVNSEEIVSSLINDAKILVSF